MTKWGTKVFAFCDARTSYVVDFNVYTGAAEHVDDGMSLTTAAVISLMDEFENQGYVLFADNFYTSTALATSVLQRRIQLVGTFRTNRRGFC